jgi:hypothetical protein
VAGGGRVQPHIGPGPREPIRDVRISEVKRGPHSLSHRHFILIFLIFGGYFQLVLVYLEK